MKTNASFIEPLEDRIAPAAVITLADVDGDTVKISSSKGKTADLQAATHGILGQITELDLSSGTWGNEFAGANIAIVVTAAGAAGDGQVDVGYVNATGINLGSLTIDGDVGKIEAGVSTGKGTAVGAIHVHSIGKLGTTTGAPDLISTFQGGAGSLTVLGDVVGADVTVLGKLGTLSIGGSLRGQGNDGEINSIGFGTAKIGGSILGGNGSGSGLVGLGSGASFTLGGSINGANGTQSGQVNLAKVGAVKIGGGVVGGSANEAGKLSIVSTAGSISIAGSVVGGSVDGSGSVVLRNCGAVIIGGSVLGGTDTNTGYVDVAIAGSVTVRGDVIGANPTNTGSILGDQIGAVSIGGNLSGGGAVDSGEILSTSLGNVKIGGNLQSATIEAAGFNTPNTAADLLVLKSLTVGGSVNSSMIEAGGFTKEKVQIGSVVVQGDWNASNLVAGVHNLGADNVSGGTGADADNVNFGDAHDARIVPSSVSFARIASIVIDGQINGTTSGTDHYGFVSEQIGSFKAGGTVIPLVVGAGNDNRTIGLTGDVTIHEV